jgi:hypothetical protein
MAVETLELVDAQGIDPRVTKLADMKPGDEIDCLVWFPDIDVPADSDTHAFVQFGLGEQVGPYNTNHVTRRLGKCGLSAGDLVRAVLPKDFPADQVPGVKDVELVGVIAKYGSIKAPHHTD